MVSNLLRSHIHVLNQIPQTFFSGGLPAMYADEDLFSGKILVIKHQIPAF
jgi:hypothetical protein